MTTQTTTNELPITNEPSTTNEPLTLDRCGWSPDQPTTTNDQTLLREIVEFYHRVLKTHNRARAYLAQRGLGNPEIIERFRIGFADRSLTINFPDKQLKAGRQIRTRLQQVGILRDTGHGHFNGSVVFPVIDSDENVTEIYGRKIGKLRSGRSKYTYLLRTTHNGQIPRGLWNTAALHDTDEVILCHSIIEALTWWSAGYHNVTAAYGHDGFTDEHITAFQTHTIQRVVLAYGNTVLGNATSASVADHLNAAGITTVRLQYPVNRDANNVATGSNCPRDVLGKLLTDVHGTVVTHGTTGAPAVMDTHAATDLRRDSEPARNFGFIRKKRA